MRFLSAMRVIYLCPVGGTAPQRCRVGYETEEKVFPDNAEFRPIRFDCILLPVRSPRRKDSLTCHRSLPFHHRTNSLHVDHQLFVHPVGGFQPDPANETADRREGHSRDGRLQESLAYPGGPEFQFGMCHGPDIAGSYVAVQRCYYN